MIGKSSRILLAILMLLAPLVSSGGELEVSEAVISRGVESRQAVGVDTVFPADVGRVYAFTRVCVAGDAGEVIHVWYHAGVVKAEVRLPVRSADWRTWSSKAVLPTWTGEWRVEVQAPDGRVLATLPFSIR